MASIGGAIRSVLVAEDYAGIGAKIYRDLAPPTTPAPYMTISDEISSNIILAGDKRVIGRSRLVQVSLWQGRETEDVTLVNQVVAVLDNAELAADQHVLGCRVFDIQRIFDSQTDTVQHAITLRVYQKV